MASLALEIREKSGLVKTHMYHLIHYKHSFVGQELVDWLMKRMGYSSECSSCLPHFVFSISLTHYIYLTFLGQSFVLVGL